MNKKRVDEWIITAKNALEKLGIAKDGKIIRTYRGHISSFGAAVIMGSFKAAVAFFAKPTKDSDNSQNQTDSVNREKLIEAMYLVISKEKKEASDIFDIICAAEGAALKELQEQFTDASIALKLAMNFFELI